MTNPNICCWTMFAIIIIGFVVSGMSAVLFGVEPVPPMFVVGAIICFGGIAFGVIMVRCPWCKRQLNLRGHWTEYCQHCGQKIE